MLLCRAEYEAAQAEIEKLRLLIRQLQRGQFGRRSEKLDPDQLQLGLEDLEQTAAAAEAAQEEVARGTATPRPPRVGGATWAPCRRTCRGSRSWSTSRTRAAPAAAGPCTRSARTRARCSTRPGPAAGEGDPPPALRLPGLRGGGGAGARPGAADHRRDGDRGAAGARAGGQVRRSPCVPNTPTAKEVWSCTRDEGGPLGVGDQELAPNRCKLRPSRAAVVSVAEKAGRDPVRCGPERRAKANR